MRNSVKTLYTLPFIITAYAMPAAAQLNVDVSAPPGGCIIGVEGGNAPGTEKPMKFEISYRVSDGNMGAVIKVNGWPKAQSADPNQNVPVTLTFDTGDSTTARSGGYSSGFNDELWAGWGAGETSDGAFAMLENASTVTVSTDEGEIGRFDLQMQGLFYRYINNCAAEQRGN